ncbi:MAG TPA: DUF3313 domain-containing protein [Allosphingosinicella sp.]
MARFALLALLLAVPTTAAFSQTEDRAPVAMPSSRQMTHDRGESWTYLRPGLNLGSYRNVMIEPTTVYSGPDSQFQGVSAANRQRYAGILTEKLRAAMAQALPVVTRAGPGTARIRLTLIGMTETTGVVATATRVSVIGFATTAMRSVTGRQGSLTGSMLIAIEVFDGGSGQLQAAAVRRRAPDALDIPATLGNQETVEAIGRDLGRAVRERFRR